MQGGCERVTKQQVPAASVPVAACEAAAARCEAMSLVEGIGQRHTHPRPAVRPQLTVVMSLGQQGPSAFAPVSPVQLAWLPSYLSLCRLSVAPACWPKRQVEMMG